MPKKTDLKGQSKTSEDVKHSKDQTDAASLVQYLIPAVFLLEPIDVVSSKMVASIILEICRSYELSMPIVLRDVI
jgi:hypothetical protein